MVILHYSLGFPPYRTGGLTKFCMDLMNQQLNEGHIVALLWPGRMMSSRIKIIPRKDINGINSFELLDPLPIPYDEGIVEIEAFIKVGEKEVFSAFLKSIRPDVIHIHTLMGLYDAFLEAAKDLGIKTIYTTHDFFPICPKVTMYRHGKICDSIKTCDQCPRCNTTALSIKKIKLLQSIPYRVLKDTKIIKKLRKQHRDNYLNETMQEQIQKERTSEDYKKLRAYYGNMLNKIDIIHCNSSITAAVYKDIFGSASKYITIPITHSSIKDNKKIKQFSDELLKIRYLGPPGGVKGYSLLKSALDILWEERQDFRLDIHFIPEKPSMYMQVHGRYTYSELENIFDETDVLVAPSIWYETFGYTVLEALSFGVPVIISGTVGAKDIMSVGVGIIIDDITSDKLLQAIRKLRPETLKNMNKAIVENQEIMTIKEMSERIMKECYGRAENGSYRQVAHYYRQRRV